ncbi:dephospho-CoA kinase [Flagellimonas lutaonensis]|nr:dephospho-CoA kinase [Allomuricauda lutaonensis]
MMIIGLTGGIGSGKTTVAKMFKKLGVPVYDSDKEAKKLMNQSKEMRAAIVDLFGKKAYKKGKLNRKFIAGAVFANKGLLSKLNAIVHPAVKSHFYDWAKKQAAPYVVQETALIFENGMEDRFDRVVLVTAPEEMRIKRVTARDKVSEEEVRARINNQLDDAHKKEKSDFVIENIDLETTRKQVETIHRELIKSPKVE